MNGKNLILQCNLNTISIYFLDRNQNVLTKLIKNERRMSYTRIYFSPSHHNACRYIFSKRSNCDRFIQSEHMNYFGACLIKNAHGILRKNSLKYFTILINFRALIDQCGISKCFIVYMSYNNVIDGALD